MEHTQKLIDRANGILDEAEAIIDGVAQYHNTVHKYYQTADVFFGHCFGSNAQYEAAVDCGVEGCSVGVTVRYYLDGRRITQFEHGWSGRISRAAAEELIEEAVERKAGIPSDLKARYFIRED